MECSWSCFEVLYILMPSVRGSADRREGGEALFRTLQIPVDKNRRPAYYIRNGYIHLRYNADRDYIT